MQGDPPPPQSPWPDRLRTAGILLVSTIAIAMTLAVVLVALAHLGSARGPRSRPQAVTQMRDIGWSLALYGSENMDSLPPGDVTQRMNTLVSNVDLDYLLVFIVRDTTSTRPTGPVLQPQNISFGLLHDQHPRWRNETDASVPMIADRMLTPQGTGSVHTKWTTDPWQGNLGWGDNHVSYEADQVLLHTFGGTLDDIFDPNNGPTWIVNPR